MLSEQEINYRTSDVVLEVTKKYQFFSKFSRERTPTTGAVGNVLDIILTQSSGKDRKAL